MKTGKPFVMFGDGRLASCKPISEADLAAFMADCVMQRDKMNQVLPIGGGAREETLHVSFAWLFGMQVVSSLCMHPMADCSNRQSVLPWLPCLQHALPAGMRAGMHALPLDADGWEWQALDSACSTKWQVTGLVPRV